ncbi:MAG: alpha/beta hydrolase [Lachnospiraceae bacterium]|nr:alpha/beta hydrolase [Lachnospiraceae bacterium]
MKNEIVTLKANADGLPLSVLVTWPGEPKALMVMHHGMCEHKERYLWLTERLAEAGFACVMADMRGHGASVKEKEDLGYFYGSGGRGLLLDLHQVLYYGKERFPGLPTVLFGHSMGTLVVRSYLRHHDYAVDAVVLSGPPCRNRAVGAGLGLVHVMQKISGSRYHSHLLFSMALAGYDRKFGGPPNAWLARDPRVAADYNASELCGFRFTVDGYRCLMELLRESYRGGWDCTKPAMPVLVMAGSDDPVIGGVKGFRDTVHFLRCEGYENVKGKLYPGNRHEIFNDDCRERAVRDLKLWLDSFLAKCQHSYGLCNECKVLG